MEYRTKLLLLIPHLGGGGAEQVAAQLARHLDPEAFEIHLCLISRDCDGAPPIPRWVQLHRFECSRTRHAWFQLIRLIRTERPEVVLCGMAHLNFLLLMLKPLLPSDLRILVRQNTTASSGAAGWLTRGLYRRIYPRADRILCQSTAMAADLTIHFGIDPSKLAVLANPIDIPASRNNERPSMSNGWPRLLAVGRLAPEKGMDLLIRAIERVRKSWPEICLQIFGAGPEEIALKALCAELHLEDAVLFSGYSSNLAAAYDEATLFVLPSRFEGLPNALLEAAAAGLPVVATPCSGGVYDLLRDAPGAWITEAISAESLAETILIAMATLSGSSLRFVHSFLAPFESRTAIAAYAAVIQASIGKNSISKDTATHDSASHLLSEEAPKKARHGRPHLERRNQSKTRIAMILPTLDAIGGAERQVLLLAKGLAARGWAVTVITLSGSSNAFTEELTSSGVAWLSLEMRKAWIDPRGWRRYLSWAGANQPEIVHTHLPHATFFARCIRLLAPVCLQIDTIHTSHPGSVARRLTYRLTHPLTDRVTCVSAPVARIVQSAGLAPWDDLAVLPNGVEIPPALPASIHANVGADVPAEPFRWIAVGRLAPVKDYPTLLRAFAALASEPTLTIAGSGAEEQNLQLLAIELGIDSRVCFAGFCADIQPLLAKADGFVLSSRWEGLPVSVLEAAAAGLPVVATNGAGTAQALLVGETGILVPVGDVSALSAAMAGVMAMPPDRRRVMGKRGRQFVCERYSLTVVLSLWEDLYRRLLEHHRRPARLGRSESSGEAKLLPGS